MGLTARIDKNDVCDLFDCALGDRLSKPWREGTCEGGRKMVGIKVAVGKDPECVGGAGLIGGLIFGAPVRGGKASRWGVPRSIQSRPRLGQKSCACVAVVTIVLNDGGAWLAEKLECGVGERLLFAPRMSEVL